MNYVKSNNPSLKYQRVAPSGRRYKGIRKFEFVAKTQFLYWKQFKVLPGVCYHIKFGPDQSTCWIQLGQANTCNKKTTTAKPTIT